MARGDELFKSFLKNKNLIEKYSISKEKLPSSLKEGLDSKVPIIKTIALIVESVQSKNTKDIDIYKKVNQYLTNEIL